MNETIKWYEKSGEAYDIVLSTRARFARNIDGIPFPARINEKQAGELINTIRAATMEKTRLPLRFYELGAKAAADPQFAALAERHVVSPLMLSGARKAAIVSEDESLSIMINEEDHLRIQAFAPGFDTDKALEQAGMAEKLISESVKYAYSAAYGYLTSCPTNLGPSLRLSCMAHLCGLERSGELSAVAADLSALGFNIRGFYGEGSRAYGSLYQISNRLSLGLTVRETAEKFKDVVRSLITLERKARQKAFENGRTAFEDNVYRAFGTMKYARSMGSGEFFTLVSAVREGTALGIVSEPTLEKLTQLYYKCLPWSVAALDGNEKKTAVPENRDRARAAMIRGIFA